ncbi:hypothetical protein IX51_03965 [uncultured archaeon]|nr:hypothetical protein IX51_03965 [uncultured archaeon]
MRQIQSVIAAAVDPIQNNGPMRPHRQTNQFKDRNTESYDINTEQPPLLAFLSWSGWVGIDY